jgi:hypothetical protein
MSDLFDYIKKLILKKLLKYVLAFISSHAVPIIIGILAFVVIVGGVTTIFDAFSKSSNGASSNQTEAMKQWAENLTDEEIQKLIESGSTINPKLIPQYIDIENKGIPSNKVVRMNVKQVTTERGDKDTDEWTENYELKLYNAAYPYRLQWKLVAGLDVIDPKSTVWEFWKRDIIDDADSKLQPEFTWLYDKHSKDVTETIQYWESYEDEDGETVTKLVKQIETTRYYPLEHLEKVSGVFADYSFEYKENVQTQDTGFEYVSGSRKYQDGKTTWREKRTVIVEDLLENVIKTPKLERISALFDSNKITIEDIRTLSEIIANMPDTADLQEDLGDILAISDIGLNAENYQSAEFNPNVPVIKGEWTRQDLLDTAMSLLDLYYFWGGKYPKKGVNPNWGKPTVVTAKGSWSTGIAIPLGLDCSGFVDWVYFQMTGTTIGKGGGTIAQFANSYPISESDLKIGDLGFYQDIGHIGIYAGKHDGKHLFIHSGGRTWKDSTHIAGRVVITYNNVSAYYKGNVPSKFKLFRRPYVKFADDLED